MNALVRMHPGATQGWTPRQLDTIRRTVAADTDGAEFDLFIEYAKVKGLDPFSKQIIAIVFSKDNPKKRRMSIVVTQDGQRVLAARCGDYHPAKPGDTIYTYSDYHIERERLLAEAAKIFKKSDRDTRVADINVNMPPDPTNPAGIIKVETKLWKGGEPVAGEAYWAEFAPIKTDDRAYEWYETGETYEDSGKPIKRRRLKQGAELAKLQVLDDSGLWPTKSHIMILKCATMQGLRAAWPETFSGVVGEEEMEKSRIIDLTASEMVEMEREERRAKAIGMSRDEYPVVDSEGVLSFIPAGQLTDHFIKLGRACQTKDALESMRLRNQEGLKRYWAGHKDEALELRKQLDGIAAKLPAKQQEETKAETEKEPATA